MAVGKLPWLLAEPIQTDLESYVVGYESRSVIEGEKCHRSIV